jgi:hypothetical protein
VEEALEQMFAETQPQLRASTIARRRAFELDTAARFESWAEQERTGRNDETRRQTVELSRILRGWFASISIAVDVSSVRFVAVRRTTRDRRSSPRREARVDLREWTRFAPLARRVGRRHREWTTPEIIGSLQAWADRHERSPLWCDLDEQRGGCPSPQTVHSHFGSFKAALQAAGLTARPAMCGPHRRWDRPGIINAVETWAQAHGRPPASGDWRQDQPEHPCSGTVLMHFGNWHNALTAAGLAPPAETPSPAA